MLYHKFSLGDSRTLIAELYEDEIITFCPTCGKEHQLEPEEIADIINRGSDFVGTSYFCNGCYIKVVK
ncbi:hypothetical protein J2Z83_003787 [Virgibacillus natechei]|uniref:Acyltransferase n=1 Tax=Virgibacillus natechei TaxID=1216297 RepID=A0ABS4IMI6_9BACI|nr:hypothetical protein [Virgibacillus natechei]MBP1971636.1 hypothetical protein [Virgibacillus natechei]UZD13038.1 hypothetical protein OLD84_00215 [Virgibacillus natechei]